MKKLIISIILILLNVNISFACMPDSVYDIHLWIYNWTNIQKYPDWNNYQFLKIDSVSTPLTNNDKLWKYYYINNKNISLENYQKWDLIIMYSYPWDYRYEDYFYIFEIWKLINKNWKLSLIDKQWEIKDFWKLMSRCKYAKQISERQLLDDIQKSMIINKDNINIKNNIFYYLSLWFLIDNFIQWKWEAYVWIWIMLQLLVYIAYWLMIFLIVKRLKK